MSAQIKYAYLKGHTWIFRRNYPKDVAMVLGSKAMKQSLKTGDVHTARVRAAQTNARYETTVAQVRGSAEEWLSNTDNIKSVSGWAQEPETALCRLRASLELSGAVERSDFGRIKQLEKIPIETVGRVYLGRRSDELRPGGFKSVRYSVGLFLSKYGERTVCSLTRADGREFLSLIAQLSPMIGKSESTRGLSLDRLVAHSAYGTVRISVRTQKRIWSQVNHFIDWLVYEGKLEQNPFRTVLFDKKVRPQPYAVPTDEEVARMLGARDNLLGTFLITCLLTGMRSGEAAGLLREDLVCKGNLGWFVHVRPNELRLLKTEAAERLVPVHPVLADLLQSLPPSGPLFPSLSVNLVTKQFAVMRKRLGLDRPGLVFHSTRKWFITQCERTGVPEHWTATLVGHRSARSENGITYGIYSAGISDIQKRSIVDQIRLPT